ncbi:hypothetical protein [Inquilinus sp. OTU3971]|uniref:hypothetical protein n=1 Tax=Inquilinus sp. OTU3971 TaxID=3043855 RepID=UPI00313D3516
MLSMNPRYANYARAHGRDPEVQFEQDRKDLPGGPLIGFVQWNQDRIREFSVEHPGAVVFGGLVNHALYDNWLTAWVERALAQ